MNFSPARAPLLLLLAFLPLALSSGSALGAAAEPAPNIHVDGTAKTTSPALVQGGNGVTLNILTYADGRSIAPSRKIGDIRATVVDMHATELVSDEDIANVVTAAMRSQLTASGFRPVDSADRAATRTPEDFQLSGSIKDLRLDVAGRDTVSIVVETTLRDSRNGKLIWSGVVSEKSDRYAGVTGNTRNSIARYLHSSLGEVAGKTIAQVSDAMHAVRPELFSQVPAAAKAPPGVEVLVAPPASPPAPAREQQAVTPPPGRLMVSTSPARAKVYVGEVYFGLSPLNVELEPGIHSLRMKLDGYKTATEKISVRKGETTELEVTLEK